MAITAQDVARVRHTSWEHEVARLRAMNELHDSHVFDWMFEDYEPDQYEQEKADERLAFECMTADEQRDMDEMEAMFNESH